MRAYIYIYIYIYYIKINLYYELEKLIPIVLKLVTCNKYFKINGKSMPA